LCDRYTWVVDRIGTDLTGGLAIEMLAQMAAKKLRDDRLVEFIHTYARQGRRRVVDRRVPGGDRRVPGTNRFIDPAECEEANSAAS
jgi:hypothetical protein